MSVRSSHIRTHRHDAASLFQSLAEEVAVRRDQRLGMASEARGTLGGRRPDRNHPLVAVATRIASHQERGEPVPEKVPAELKTRGGGEGLLAELWSYVEQFLSWLLHLLTGIVTEAKKFGDEVASLWGCAKLAAELIEKKMRGDTAAAQQLEDELKFSTCDPEWLEAILQYEKYFGPSGHKREIPYVRYRQMDDFVLETLPRNATVAVIGDWGTGTEAATALLSQVASHAPDVLIHLGDIYYSGTPNECQKYFLDVIDAVFDRRGDGSGDHPPLPIYTMTGNHDMYCGGVGYYDLLPSLNPSPPFTPEQAQPASYCALRSPDGAWQLVLMDTGLHDHDPFTVSKDVTYLDPQEEDWHADKIERFGRGGGRTLLFSHHQLFSAFSGIGDYQSRPPDQQALNPKLYASFQRFAQAGDIAGWFWGHEHNLCVYQPYKGLAKGVCMGHAAIPTFLDDDPYTPLVGVADLPRLVTDPADPAKSLQLGADGDVYAHGFAILRLDDDNRTARVGYYVDTQEEPIYEEVL